MTNKILLGTYLREKVQKERGSVAEDSRKKCHFLTKKNRRRKSVGGR